MKKLSEQGLISPVPLKKLAKVYFVRTENDVVTDEGWITVDEARRKNAQDRRAHGATVNKYFEDSDSAEQYTRSLKGPELPEEPGPLGPEPEPGLEPEGLGGDEEANLDVPDFGLDDEPELGMGEEPELGPELGPPEIEPEEDEVLEIEVPRKIRLKPPKKNIGGFPGESIEAFDELVELEEQEWPQTPNAPPLKELGDYMRRSIPLFKKWQDIIDREGPDSPAGRQATEALAKLYDMFDVRLPQLSELPSEPDISQQASKQREEPLDEQGPHTEYAPGSQVQTRGGKVLEVVRDVTNGDPLAIKRYLVRDENNQEFEVLANRITPYEPDRFTKAGFWDRMLGRRAQGVQTRFPALGGESLEDMKQEAAAKCRFCGATDIQEGICMNCRRKAEAIENEQHTKQEDADDDSESTEEGVIEAVLAGNVTGAAAVEALYGLTKTEKCPGKPLKRARKAAAKTYDPEREPSAFWGTAAKISGLMRKKRGEKS